MAHLPVVEMGLSTPYIRQDGESTSTGRRGGVRSRNRNHEEAEVDECDAGEMPGLRMHLPGRRGTLGQRGVMG